MPGTHRLLPSLILVWIVAAPLDAQTVVIDFDGVSAPGAFHQVPPGFANGPLLDYPEVTVDGGVILLDVLFGHTATSGPNIYATCDTCGLGDTPPSGLPGKVFGTFKQDVDQVAIDVINGFGGSGASFTLTVFDQGGMVVAGDTVLTGPAGSANPTGHLSVAGSGIRSFEVTTGMSGGYTFATDTLVFRIEDTPFTNLGGGIVGAHQETPTLVGSGTLVAGAPTTLTVDDARPGAAALLLLSPNPLGVPVFGGTLWPDPSPPGLVAPASIDATGGLVIGAAWPAGVPSGLSLYFQVFVSDAAAAGGAAATNGLLAVVP